LCWWWLLLNGTEGFKVQIGFGFLFFSHDGAVEHVLLLTIFILWLPAFLLLWLLELLPIHATSCFGRHHGNLGGIILLNDDAQGFNYVRLRVVEIRQLDRKVELVDKLVGFGFRDLGLLDELLIDFDGLLGLICIKLGESF